MAGNLFKDALPNDFFSYEMGIHLDEGFIAFMKVWMKLFPTPDILAFVGLSGFKEKTEGELTENNLLYRVRKINRVERYAVYLRSLDDLLRALKARYLKLIMDLRDTSSSREWARCRTFLPGMILRG
ncbi:hypothetical protein QS257_19830 [Terrilactibacillus sp. S3-3]|nr:hypothetical protein QS257_19830 [Terrilactibacillus sp. S3-3]